MNFSQHVGSVTVSCNQRLYLMAQLRKQGLGITTLDTVFQSIIRSNIMNTLSVYFGYLTERQKHQLQQICGGAKRRCLTLYDYSIEVVADRADYDLSRQSCSEYHCLHHIYTQ